MYPLKSRENMKRQRSRREKERIHIFFQIIQITLLFLEKSVEFRILRNFSLQMISCRNGTLIILEKFRKARKKKKLKKDYGPP